MAETKQAASLMSIEELKQKLGVSDEGHIKATLDEEETKKVAQEEIMWYASGRAKDEGKA